jgi:outer membrane receptor protein involved in Fe transport
VLNKRNSIKIFGTLLISSALTTPAFAQIETVVVTAEKTAENLQTVPIAVTSISGDELKQKNIFNFKDLQYNVPNVTYQKGSLGSGAVTIRGVGQAAGDPGISQYQDGIFSEDNDLATADYFDLASIEVLRGPQGTLYGRASVGGLINVNSAHPDLDAFAANGDFTYGEFNTIKGTGVVNIPITDTLGVRLAGQYSGHDGFIKNIAPGTQDPDSQNIYSTRGSIRWQPTSTTTIDVVGSYDNEADSRDRIDGIECHTDPTGVIGCLPDKLTFQPINSLGNAIGVLDSKQWMGTVGEGVGLTASNGYGINITAAPGPANLQSGAFPAGAALSGLLGNLQALGDISAAQLATANVAIGLGANQPFGPVTTNTALFLTLLGGYQAAGAKAGIFDLSQVAGSLGTGTSPSITAAMPQKLGVVNNANNTQFDEVHSSYSLHLNQKLGSWLTADALVGYSATSRHSQGPYSYFPTEQYNDPYYTNSFTASSANNPLIGLTQFAALAGNPAGRVANIIADYFPNFGTPGAAQLFPLSNFNPGGVALLPGTVGSAGGGISKFVTGNSAADLETFHGRETSTELRFTSNLDGPFNFTTGLFYYDRRNYNEPYQVTFNGGDYFGIFMGAAYGALFPSSNLNPIVAVDPYYYQNLSTTSSSKATYFDFTYDLIPDELKFKGGLRWQEDADQLIDDHLSFTGLNSPSSLACGAGGAATFCFLPASSSASAIIPAAAAYEAAGTTTNPIKTDRINGRAVLQWSPKLDFTDQSMFYASYAVGSKAGNVNLVSGVAAAEGVPTSYKPEDLTSYEVGTKNLLFDGALQANLTGWYYDYKNFQYTVTQYSTLFTDNFNAHMWGEEGEFIWQPDEHWQFNLNVTNSDSSINGGQYAADARNPTAGLTNAILIKDTGLSGGDFPGGNCVLMTNNGIDPANDPNVATYYALQGQSNPFVAPFGTEAGATSLRNANPANNIQFANFGTCTANTTALDAYLAAHGEPANAYQYASSATSPGSSISGIAVPLKGRKVLNLPNNTVSVGGQYTFLVDNYKIVPRVDYYWQNGYFSRIFNDPTDAVPSWDQLNLQVQLTAPDDQWYARLFATNVIGTRNVIGLSPQADTSGVPTYVSTLDPRIIGITLGGKW